LLSLNRSVALIIATSDQSLGLLDRCGTLETARYVSGPGRGSLEDIFQIVIVILVQSADGQEFLGAFQLALHDSVFLARGGFQC
jgi:hypothetical protein